MEDELVYEPAAEGICLLYNKYDMKLFEVKCDCQDSDHSVYVEFDHDIDMNTITIYTQGVLPFVKGLGRIKAALKILFTGRYQLETNTILTKQGAINLANTLLENVK